jgi:hypothetical protein
LADGFESIGYRAIALPAPISSKELLQKCKEFKIDVVIQVNRTRDPEVPLPANVRYISWFQDVFPGTMNGFADGFRDSDILYALGDHEVLGLNVPLPCYVGSLVTGVDQSVLEYRKSKIVNQIDFSLCGYIPPPIENKIKLWRFLLPGFLRYNMSEIMLQTVKDAYDPLSGALDIHELSSAISRNIDKYQSKRTSVRRHLETWLFGLFSKNKTQGNKKSLLLQQIERATDYFTREYPRLLDRVALIENALMVSCSLELYGPGWDKHPSFRPYAKGIINTQDGLLDIYSRSRINLNNNTHGLGLHSRTLECMAIGGCIFMHTSPHDNKPGGMLTSFEPGVHYGSYNVENIQEEAARWLKDGTHREQVGVAASKIIMQEHCWHHRAQQIIDDLKR